MTDSNASDDAEVRRQLILSFPDLDIEHNPVAVVACLVEGAAHAIIRQRDRSNLVTAVEAIKKIKELTGLEYEKVEVIVAFKYLAGRGHLSFAHERSDCVVFSEGRLTQLQTVLSDRLELENVVREEWFVDLRRRYSLARDQLEQLWSGLQTFVTATINVHAAEAAAHLYLATDMDQARFYDILSARLPLVDDQIPESLREIARREFVAFFRTAGKPRVQYLAFRLRGSFLYHLLAIDPRASELVRGSVAGKALFLDSNVLYRVLGLEGPALMFGPATTLEIARKLDCRLVVTGETINEFLHSLRAEADRVRAIPIERRTYQQLVAEHPTDEWAFMYAYYRELTSGRVKNLDEFERKYSNVEKFLSQWQVEIQEDALLTDDERADSGYRDQLSELNQWHNNEKGLSTLEHDIFMIRLIRRLRGPSDRTVGATRYWFLTYDRQLTRFTVHRAKSGLLPACMLGDSWLQIARPFLPRTDEYEKSLAALLQHPLLYHDERAVPFDHIVHALHRLERYEEIPTTVLAGMLADGEFMRRFQQAPTEKEERALLELKLAAVAKEAAQRSAQAEGELERALQRIGILEANAEAERREKELALQASARALNASQEQFAHTQAESEERIGALRVGFEQRISESETRFGSRLRWTVYGFSVAVLGLTLTASLLVRGATLGAVEGAVWIGWFFLAATLLLAIPLRTRWGAVANVASIVGTILSLLGLTYQLISLGKVATPQAAEVAPSDTAPTPALGPDSAKRPVAPRE